MYTIKTDIFFYDGNCKIGQLKFYSMVVINDSYYIAIKYLVQSSSLVYLDRGNYDCHSVDLM